MRAFLVGFSLDGQNVSMVVKQLYSRTYVSYYIIAYSGLLISFARAAILIS